MTLIITIQIQSDFTAYIGKLFRKLKIKIGVHLYNILEKHHQRVMIVTSLKRTDSYGKQISNIRMGRNHERLKTQIKETHVIGDTCLRK